MKRFRNGKLLVCTFVLLIFAAVLLLSLSLDRNNGQSSSSSPTRDRYLPIIEYNGKKYIMNDDIQTVLFAGIDNFGEAESSEVYYNYGQADFLMLGIFNKAEKTYSLLHINRDTMSEVPVLGLGGKRAGKEVMQLALAHCYGSGMEDSCENTVEAVSDFLDGTEIDRYFTMNMDGVPMLNDAVGGVELTVTEDFPGYDELKKGNDVVLKGEQALIYVRGRLDVADGTNVNRMGRQRQYIQAFFDTLDDHVNDDKFISTAFDLVSDYVVTDMDVNGINDMANWFSEFEFDGVYTIEGTADYDGEYVEFYADEQKLTEQIIRLMYLEYK